MTWLKQLSDAVSKLTDIFNLGRLVFYTAAGALLAYPAAAAVGALAGPLRGDALGELLCAGKALDRDVMIFASVVAGFVIASYGFARVLEPISSAVKAKAEASPLDRRAYPFRYPMLRNQDGQDYDDWLIREYFRFVEIVTYIPLGLLGGLAASTLYSGAYVLVWAGGGHGARLAGPHAVFGALAAAYAVCAFLVWPRLWLPGVVAPVLHAYHRAKLALVVAVEELPPKPSRAPSSAPSAGKPPAEVAGKARAEPAAAAEPSGKGTP